jgi:hypothetical protein
LVEVWIVNGVVDHLAMSRHLNEAYKLLERGDPFDAAEKIWVTVKHATTVLTMAVLKEATPPKGFVEFVR